MRNARTIATKQRITIFVLFVVPFVVLSAFLWKLHTPSPRVKTSTVINRTSLLPHRFAGPCINCHRIEDVGPIAINRANMHKFRLSPRDQKLLLAGQRVDVPSGAQQMRTPAIVRDDVLPHTFVGACSNCHVVLDVRPSRAYMRKAMRRAYQPLATSGLKAERIARGGTRERHSRELYRNIYGFIALGFFGLSTVYVAIRGLMRRYPQTFKGAFRVKKWFSIHVWASIGFCLAAILHWHYSDRGNNMLHLGLVITVWLTVAGLALRYRMPTKGTRKNVQLLHSQRVLFLGLIVLLIVGHFFVDFD